MNARRLLPALLPIALLAIAAMLACEGKGTSRSGERLWNDLGCINCHGPDGSGMAGFGPTLHGKKSLWTREKLVLYLRDPVGYARKDPRLKQQARHYMTPMPPVLTPDPVEVDRIVDHALAMP